MHPSVQKLIDEDLAKVKAGSRRTMMLCGIGIAVLLGIGAAVAASQHSTHVNHVAGLDRRSPDYDYAKTVAANERYFKDKLTMDGLYFGLPSALLLLIAGFAWLGGRRRSDPKTSPLYLALAKGRERAVWLYSTHQLTTVNYKASRNGPTVGQDKYSVIEVVIACDDNTSHRIPILEFGRELRVLEALSAEMPWCTVGYSEELRDRYAAAPGSLRRVPGAEPPAESTVDLQAWEANLARIKELTAQTDDGRLRLFLCACIEHVLPRGGDLGPAGRWLRVAQQFARGEVDGAARESALREAKAAGAGPSPGSAVDREILAAIVCALGPTVYPCTAAERLSELPGRKAGSKSARSASAMQECAWQKAELEMLAFAPPMLLTPAQRADLWFPPGEFPGLREKSRAGMLASGMARMGEAPLSGAAAGTAILRLFVDASRGPSMLVVASFREGRWYVQGARDDEPNTVSRSAERVLEGALLERFTAAWSRLGLHQGYVPSTQEGHDGETWLLESVEGSRYRAVCVWDPQGALHDVGSCLLEACGYTLYG